MNHHINSIGYACQKYFQAANLVQATFRSSGGRRTLATDVAMEGLQEQHEHLQSVCDNAEGFLDMKKIQVPEMGVAHHIDALDPNRARPVSVRPVNAQPVREYMFQPQNMWQRPMESDARYGGAGDGSEESAAASSKILVELDSNVLQHDKKGS